jgi:hypothetical protein
VGCGANDAGAAVVAAAAVSAHALGQSFQDEFLIGRAGHASNAFSKPLLHKKADACVRAAAPHFNAVHARARHTRRTPGRKRCAKL